MSALLLSTVDHCDGKLLDFNEYIPYFSVKKTVPGEGRWGGGEMGE
jgi:hypothetical protein